MQYILPTEKFEELINVNNWNSLLNLGIDECYIFSIIIMHLKVNGQLELDGSVSIPDYKCLEQEILYGNLQYIYDDVREKFLYTRTNLPPKQIIKAVTHYVLLMFTSLGSLLTEMIKSLQLKNRFELQNLNIRWCGKVFRGIMVDINFNRNAHLTRGFHYA